MMVGCIFAINDKRLSERVAERTRGQRSADELRQRGLIIGGPGEMVEQIGRLAAAGVQRIMLQWLDLDDIAGLEAIAGKVIPQLTN
jgi:hypothetical protein